MIEQATAWLSARQRIGDAAWLYNRLVVLNCITLENFFRGWERLRELQLEPEATSVQLAHSRPLGRLHSLDPENPIFILRAQKQ